MSERKRNKGIYFMVSDKEREMIEKRMEQSGIISIRAFLLKLALNGCIVQLDLSDVRALTKEMGKMSNNLNQCAKRAHETGNIYEADIRDLQERLEGIWEMVSGILKSLSKLK